MGLVEVHHLQCDVCHRIFAEPYRYGDPYPEPWIGVVSTHMSVDVCGSACAIMYVEELRRIIRRIERKTVREAEPRD